MESYKIPLFENFDVTSTYAGNTISDGRRSKYGNESGMEIEEAVEFVTYFKKELLSNPDPDWIRNKIKSLEINQSFNFGVYGDIIEIYITKE